MSGLPINVGLVRRAIAEVWPSTLLLAGLAGGISYLMGYAFPRVQERIMERGGPTASLMKFRAAFLGDESALAMPAQIAASIHWSHPVLLALIFAQIIVVCTRVPAGETERGTIDLLMGLPVSRWQVYVSETAVYLLSAAFMLLAAAAGAYLARSSVNPKVLVPWGSVVPVLVNLAALQVAVIGVVSLFGTLSERRGRAVLAGVAVVLIWILGEFMGGLWEPARKVEWLSAIHYYKPMSVVRAAEVPWLHVSILTLVGAAAWTVGGNILARRALTSL